MNDLVKLIADMEAEAAARARLREVVEWFGESEPVFVVAQSMREGRGFCHAGTAHQHRIVGFGIVGQGETKATAAADWLRQAREVLE